MTNKIKLAKYFVIDGNANIIGNENYNLILSLKRAIKTAEKLQNSLYKKIIANGENNPISDKNSENRRVQEGE